MARPNTHTKFRVFTLPCGHVVSVPRQKGQPKNLSEINYVCNQGKCADKKK